jgi:hypothetical protein
LTLEKVKSEDYQFEKLKSIVPEIIKSQKEKFVASLDKEAVVSVEPVD